MVSSFVVRILVILVFTAGFAQAQIIPASPANWLFPQGNSEALNVQVQPSFLPQSMDSLAVKWVSDELYGDIQPLVGNLVSNEKLISTLPYGPNEIAAVASNGGSSEVVIIGGDGKVLSRRPAPRFVSNISVLFDSLALLPSTFTTFPVVMGLEVLEHDGGSDSLAHAYVAAYDGINDTIQLIKRLTIDLRDYAPNNSASVRPVLGRSDGSEMLVYAIVNMNRPNVPNPRPIDPPYVRALAQFETRDFTFPFPQPDIVDRDDLRFTVAPEIVYGSPSFRNDGFGNINGLIPCFPSNSITLFDPIFSPTFEPTFPDVPYLMQVDMDGASIQGGTAFGEIVDIQLPLRTRPRVRPLYVDLIDAGQGLTEETFILVAEEYSGIPSEGSFGTAGLHLYDAVTGVPLTFPYDVSPLEEERSFEGGQNHGWSIAVGDVDGIFPSLNPTYPNNPGNEIILTQTTKEQSVAGNRLSVLRYRTGARIEKPNAQGDSLYYLDTIASQPINGWLACVGDIDRAPDGKFELFVVDGTVNSLLVLNLRDYDEPEMYFGQPFDTLYTYGFGASENISAVRVVDADGDGKNDILVTTSQRTYLLGTPLKGALVTTYPADPLAPTYCRGDTIDLTWANVFGGNSTVNIYFQPYSPGLVPFGPRIPIETSYPNALDTMSYIVDIDALNLSGFGRFVIERSPNADVGDSTAIVEILAQELTIGGPLALSEYTVDDVVRVTGASQCLTDIVVQYFVQGSSTSTWQDAGLAVLAPNGTFTFDWTVPCLDIFSCVDNPIDSVVVLRAVGEYPSFTGIIEEFSSEVPIIVRSDTMSLSSSPDPFVACPERTIQWQNVPAILDCDSLSLSYSVDGEVWEFIERVAALDGEYRWRVPLGLPDTVTVSVCCNSGCVRNELVVTGTNVQYVDVVAPNPFDPTNTPPGQSLPGVNVIYTVPAESSVSITVYDQANRIVARPLQNAYREPDVVHCDNWDGLIDEGGRVAPNGMYYLVFETDTGVREVYHVYVAKGY